MWICVSPSDGSSRNVPGSTRCSNSTSKGSHATVILGASQIVEDPGVPTATVMWKWKDTDEIISGQVSGQHRNLLEVAVTRDDRLREAIALYDNAICHTMQTFNLQCAKCKMLLCNILECIVFIYSRASLIRTSLIRTLANPNVPNCLTSSFQRAFRIPRPCANVLSYPGNNKHLIISGYTFSCRQTKI